MEYLIIVVLAIVIFYIMFQNMTNCDKNKTDNDEHMYGGTLTQLISRDLGDVYLTVNTEKYVPEYNYGYGYGYRRSHYYNRFTPFIWNNATRWPKIPYYAHVHDWYKDTYATPYWYYW